MPTFENELEAVEYLQNRKFKTSNNLITKDNKDYDDLSDEEQAAVDYLCDEFDYEWSDCDE